MFMTCDSDAAVFILNVSLTSTFCLRRECKSLKPAVVLLLAVSDWCAVVMRSFYRLSRDKDLWFVTSCICEQPQVLLQTGIFVLNVIVLILNDDLTETGHFIKRSSYVHLLLFNSASIILANAITRVITQAIGDVEGALESSYVFGTFLLGVYRTVFLFLDSLYFTYVIIGDKSNICMHKLRLEEKTVITII